MGGHGNLWISFLLLEPERTSVYFALALLIVVWGEVPEEEWKASIPKPKEKVRPQESPWKEQRSLQQEAPAPASLLLSTGGLLCHGLGRLGRLGGTGGGAEAAALSCWNGAW